MLYLVWYTDGAFSIYAHKQEPKNHQDKVRIYEVSPALTVEDISEVCSGNGWLLGTFPARLEGMIERIH